MSQSGLGIEQELAETSPSIFSHLQGTLFPQCLQIAISVFTEQRAQLTVERRLRLCSQERAPKHRPPHLLTFFFPRAFAANLARVPGGRVMRDSFIMTTLAVLTASVCAIPPTPVMGPAFPIMAGLNIPWFSFGFDLGGGAFNQSWFTQFFEQAKANKQNNCPLLGSL